MRNFRDIFRLRKREHSRSHVTDKKDENGRKGQIRKKYFKQLLILVILILARKYFVFYGKRIKFAVRFGKYKK